MAQPAALCRPARALALALCLMFLAGACQSARENVSVGDGIPIEAPDDDSSPTTSPEGDDQPETSTPATGAPTAGTPATGAPKEGATNQGIARHPAGWKLTLTVDGRLTYPRSQDIVLEVVARNDGKQALQYDPNDPRHFAIIPAGGAKGRTWYDTDCRPRQAEVTGGAITLEPGEEAVFKATYPGPGIDGNKDACRLDPGDYDVGGLVAWCPPGSVQGDGTCDARKRDVVASGAVRIKIVP